MVGRSGNEVLAAVVERMEAEGIDGHIYTHPIGDVMRKSFFLLACALKSLKAAAGRLSDAAGPNIGLWDLHNGPLASSGELELRAETWFSIELSAYAGVPEWGGQRVSFKQEEDAVVREPAAGGNGWVHRGGRQAATEMHLVR